MCWREIRKKRLVSVSLCGRKRYFRGKYTYSARIVLDSYTLLLSHGVIHAKFVVLRRNTPYGYDQFNGNINAHRIGAHFVYTD